MVLKKHIKKYYKNFQFLTLLILFSFFSCKKIPIYHKIKFEVIFIEVPDPGFTNWYEVGAEPNYINENTYNYSVDVPVIHTSLAVQNRYWKYEYWELVDQDVIDFHCSAAQNNLYEMRVYIDDIEVAYKKIYNYSILDQGGIHDSTYSGSTITFTYNE